MVDYNVANIINGYIVELIDSYTMERPLIVITRNFRQVIDKLCVFYDCGLLPEELFNEHVTDVVSFFRENVISDYVKN